MEATMKELKDALRAQGRDDVESATVLTAAATLRTPGKSFLPPVAAHAFKSSCLGPLFSRFAVQKGRAVEISQASFDCSKLGRYHFHVDPSLVPSANNHPFQDWLDRLRDFTGTHSLSPAPLVPWPVYRGTLMHTISCCLVGLELYWQALAVATAQELNGDNYSRYLALLGRGSDAEDEIDHIIHALNPEGGERGGGRGGALLSPAQTENAGSGDSGLDVFYHPIVVQGVCNVLARVIIIMDIVGTQGGCAANLIKKKHTHTDHGVYVPWPDRASAQTHDACILPPLCVAWESAARTRLVPLIPTALSESCCRVLPQQLIPPLAFPRQQACMLSSYISTDRQGRALLMCPAAKSMSPAFLEDLISVMSATFRRVTGIHLQAVVDVRSILLDLGVADMHLEELILDTAEAAAEGRLLYNPIACQMTMRRGIYTSAHLAAPHGRLYLAALHEAANAPASIAPQHPSALGRCVGGVRLLGVDVPICMPPGMLRVIVSVERMKGAAQGGGEMGGEKVAQSVFLIVSNTSPSGLVRSARVSKPLADVEVALGIEVPLRETGVHNIAISVSPVYRSDSTGAPLSVPILDAGNYDVLVEDGANERRANEAHTGMRADYSEGIRLKCEPACLFRISPAGLVACEKVACRVTGDVNVRAVTASGEPEYHNGDCTLTASRAGSCCDRKHFWEGQEYDNYPVIFNLSLNCPTHFDPSGNTIVTVVWHEAESNPMLNSNVYQVSTAIVEKFWPDEAECPWYGWEAQLHDVILREMPQERESKMRACPRRRWLSGYVGGVDMSH